MSSTDRSDSELLRIRLLYVFMVCSFIFLGIALLREQVFHGSRYRSSSERQSMRRVRVSAERGRILDRNGVCLADNRPSYCIAVYVEELRQPGRWSRTVAKVMDVLQDVEDIIKIEKQLKEEDVYSHIRKKLPLPLVAWRDVDHRALARLAESGRALPGIDVYYEPVRVYPAHKYTAHVVGYVGRADIDEKDYHFYLPEMQGRRGIEFAYNDQLAGEAGGKLLRVDASGFRYDEQKEKECIAGRDVVLTIDLHIQKVLTKALEGKCGAAVVMDPRNGNILALVSAPSFNPNLFSPAISAKNWSALNRDAEVPLLNRAVSGMYAPGSTYKPMVAIAALETGAATGGTSFNCPGYFQLGSVKFNCWKDSGHGTIAMREAIEQSCNAYFCHLGLKSGIESVYAASDFFGFGHITGIDIDGEQKGLLPNEAWKKRALGDGWRSGDTCNMSIGQGALLVTPLQMAVFVSTIANGGFVYRPRLSAQMPDQGELLRRMTWSSSTMGIVRAGMRDVIEADTGTGKRAKIAAAEMAGKTGTAEYGPRGEGRKKNTWMTVFAPYSSPRYAIAVIVQDGDSGGRTCAPIVHDVMTALFEAEKETARAL